MEKQKVIRTVEATAVCLFFVQAVRVLFSILFGLIYDAVFAETLALSTLGFIMGLVVLAFMASLMAPRRHRRPLLLITSIIAALARIPLTLNQPTVRLWSSLLIVGAVVIYTATLLREHPHVFPTSLTLAFAADHARLLGEAVDLVAFRAEAETL